MNALNWKQVQKGFTLIELIITIVIIGVLAAVAIPKFISLSSDAEKGVALGIGGSLASATSVNYAKSRVPGAVAPGDYRAIADCAAIETNKTTFADIPSGYIVSGGATLNGVNLGSAQLCTITTPGLATVTFSAYGA